MAQARDLFDQGSWAQALGALEQYREPDEVYDREKQLLTQLCTLELARQAIREGRAIYAGQLLESCPEEGGYCAEALRREKLLLLGKLPGERVSNLLPSLDEELMIRAGEAVKEKQSDRAAALLDACESQGGSDWQLLRGRLWLEKGEYAKARDVLLAARDRYPRETAPMLEICFRELGDYKSAYEYACRQRR
jgi:hypothetical protein